MINVEGLRFSPFLLSFLSLFLARRTLVRSAAAREFEKQPSVVFRERDRARESPPIRDERSINYKSLYSRKASLRGGRSSNVYTERVDISNRARSGIKPFCHLIKRLILIRIIYDDPATSVLRLSRYHTDRANIFTAFRRRYSATGVDNTLKNDLILIYLTADVCYRGYKIAGNVIKFLTSIVYNMLIRH